MNDLSKMILDYRARHNLSGQEFAKLCNLTVQTIYAIENGYQDASKLTKQKILSVIEKEKE